MLASTSTSQSSSNHRTVSPEPYCHSVAGMSAVLPCCITATTVPAVNHVPHRTSTALEPQYVVSLRSRIAADLCHEPLHHVCAAIRTRQQQCSATILHDKPQNASHLNRASQTHTSHDRVAPPTLSRSDAASLPAFATSHCATSTSPYLHASSSAEHPSCIANHDACVTTATANADHTARTLSRSDLASQLACVTSHFTNSTLPAQHARSSAVSPL